MTDRKLTEAEMISYLKLSVAIGNTASLAPEEAQTLLDLINRQKAEIERLQADIASACVFLEERRKIREQEHKTQIELLDQIKEQIPLVLARAKAEAVKEFADRVDKKFAQCQREYRNVLNNDGACAMIIARKVVVDIAKEITEERTE